MKKNRLSKCTVFLLILCLLFSMAVMAAAEAEDAPPDGGNPPSDVPGGGISPDVPGGGGSPDVPGGGGSPDVPGGGVSPDVPGGNSPSDNPGGGTVPDEPPAPQETRAPAPPQKKAGSAVNATNAANAGASNGKDVFYSLTEDGKLINILRQDGATGNYYSLEGSGGYFGFYISQDPLTGWQYINGKWYYLNADKDGTPGACLIGPGVTPDGYEIDANGAWTGR